MNPIDNKPQIAIKYFLITILSVCISWLVHEFAHWSIGELLGNSMKMTLNTCYPENGKYIEDWHSLPVSAAGPAVTLMQGIFFYFLLRTTSNLFLFPFLLITFYMRFLAGVMNLFNLNDEGRISKYFDLGTFTLPLLVSGLLFYLVYDIVKRKRFGSKLVLLTVLMIMLFSSVIILFDNACHFIIL